MPDFELEDNLKGLWAGADEAGRGPWAGPVVVGAVLIKDKKLPPFLLKELDDSKKLSAKKREALFETLSAAQSEGKVSIGIGLASAAEIDRINILQATFLALRRAVSALDVKPAGLLFDGNQKPSDFFCPVRPVIKGDGKSYSIAAASVAAKVYRDRLMAELAKQYPYYGFEKNAGYGTRAHAEGMALYGLCPEHRLSYRPVKEVLLQKAG